MRLLSIVTLPFVFVCIFGCAVDADVHASAAHGIASPRAGALTRRKRRFLILRKTPLDWEKQHSNEYVLSKQPNFHRNDQAEKGTATQHSVTTAAPEGGASIPNEVFNLVKVWRVIGKSFQQHSVILLTPATEHQFWIFPLSINCIHF